MTACPRAYKRGLSVGTGRRLVATNAGFGPGFNVVV